MFYAVSWRGKLVCLPSLYFVNTPTFLSFTLSFRTWERLYFFILQNMGTALFSLYQEIKCLQTIKGFLICGVYSCIVKLFYEKSVAWGMYSTCGCLQGIGRLQSHPLSKIEEESEQDWTVCVTLGQRIRAGEENMSLPGEQARGDKFRGNHSNVEVN